MKLTDYKTLTFDCYGTLIDWESGIWDALQPLIARSGRNDITRETALRAFATCESAREREAPTELYPALLTHVHGEIARHFGIEADAALDAAFGASVPHWPAFPDSADALRILKQHFELVILSNVNRAGFAASSLKLGVEFDAVYTAEDVGSYKPAKANFDYMLKHLGSDLGRGGGEVLHTAQSLHHDHVPARAAGLANCWIDRQRLSTGGEWGATAIVEARPDYDFLFFDMMSMARTVLAERGE